MSRTASIKRKTNETNIELKLDLDGTGKARIKTGVGFFDHMLELFTRHSLIDLEVSALGDLDVDQHHTVEDVGICLGQALAEAIGDKQGIYRYGSTTLPMEETLVTTAVDLSGRFFLAYNAEFSASKIGEFDTELVQEFWQAVGVNALCNIHILLHHGTNNHHISEAIFKSAARSIRAAIEIDPRQTGVPSTKGTL